MVDIQNLAEVYYSLLIKKNPLSVIKLLETVEGLQIGT